MSWAKKEKTHFCSDDTVSLLSVGSQTHIYQFMHFFPVVWASETDPWSKIQILGNVSVKQCRIIFSELCEYLPVSVAMRLPSRNPPPSLGMMAGVQRLSRVVTCWASPGTWRWTPGLFVNCKIWNHTLSMCIVGLQPASPDCSWNSRCLMAL